MPQPLQARVLDFLKRPHYRPLRPRRLAEQLRVHDDETYPQFRDAVKDLMVAGRVRVGTHGGLEVGMMLRVTSAGGATAERGESSAKRGGSTTHRNRSTSERQASDVDAPTSAPGGEPSSAPLAVSQGEPPVVRDLRDPKRAEAARLRREAEEAERTARRAARTKAAEESGTSASGDTSLDTEGSTSTDHTRSTRARDQADGIGQSTDTDAASDNNAREDADADDAPETDTPGHLVMAPTNIAMVPSQRIHASDEITGAYRHNKRGFGFVIPTDPLGHEDLFIPEGNNGGAINSDIVRAKITSRGFRDGKQMFTGRVIEVIERKSTRFVGTVTKKGNEWYVLPDGNQFTDAIFTPDAAGKYVKPGTKVVVQMTQFPTNDYNAQGVIEEVLGAEGEKDVDLKTVIVQHNLPGDFPQEVKDEAARITSEFDAEEEAKTRLDLTDEVITTIDPDDAKDYDDAISITKLAGGKWELGVHIADVSHFVKPGSPLDIEAAERGNSTYFPGHVIPMLPEVLSNGICSLQEGVPRLVKSAFITYDKNAKPTATRFANSVIKSRKRLRYREAQALIDNDDVIPHPDGDKTRDDYEPEVLEKLAEMNTLSRMIQKRRQAAGQINLSLPQVDLVLDENGKVIDAKPEDHSFTHTLIEMFMVEANEAVARLLDSLNVPFLRRAHPEPDAKAAERLKTFVKIAGHSFPSEMDRHAIQALLAKVKGKPEAFSINLAVLKSLTRAEYSPKNIGHYALASTNYCHFTSPIRRYADLTIHRLLDAYFAAAKADFTDGPLAKGRKKITLQNVPDEQTASATGKRISYTERRSEDAERELRQVKTLDLMANHVGEEFQGVVTGITNFGLFIQLDYWLVDGLQRFQTLLNDYWEVDEKQGMVRGRRTGQKIRIGDVTRVRVARVDLPRRELDLQVLEVLSRGANGAPLEETAAPATQPVKKGKRAATPRKPKADGETKRAARSKSRDKAKSVKPGRRQVTKKKK